MVRIFNKLVCGLFSVSLLVSSVGLSTHHDSDDRDEDTPASSQASYSFISGQTQPAASHHKACDHACHAVYHFLGIASGSFHLPQIIAHKPRLTALTIPPELLFSWQFFKPPRLA